MTKPYLDLNSRLAYASERELNWLAEYGAAHADATVVLIGAGPGVMALALLDSHTPISLHVIDNALSDTFRKHIEWAQVAMPHIIEGDSAELGVAWSGAAIDLLIVDGDHSYDGVLRDLYAWTPRVKLGGFVFLHDYYRKGEEWEGVSRAHKDWQDEKVQGYARSTVVDSTVILKRMK